MTRIGKHGFVIAGMTLMLTMLYPGVHASAAGEFASLSITSPGNGHTVPVGTPIKFIAGADDGVGGDLSDEILWSNEDGKFLGTGPSITLTLPEGTHKIIALLTTEDKSMSRDVIVVVSDSTNTAPNVTITSPNNGMSFTVGSPITFRATATDVEDSDDTLLISWKSNPPGMSKAGSTVTHNFHPGTYTITATATDSGNSTGVDEISITVSNPVVDIEPTVQITSPIGGQHFPSGSAITFTATATDAEDDDSDLSIEWSSVPAGVTGTGTSVSATLQPGDFVVLATVTDSAGNKGYSNITVIIDEPLVDHKPYIEIRYPSDGYSYPADVPIEFTARAFDAEDDNSDLLVVWSSSPPGLSGTGLSITGTLSPNTYTITATATDSGNNTSSDEIRVTFNQDHSPKIRITSPIGGQHFPSGSVITFTATAADAEDDDSDLSIEWSSVPAGVTGTGTSVSATLQPGTYTVEASVTDSVGNTGESAIVVVVDAPNANNQDDVPPVTYVTLNVMAFTDENGDGTMDDTEIPLSDLMVMTYTPSTGETDILITGEDGTISKSDLTPDSFYVLVLPPPNHSVTTNPFTINDTIYYGIIYVENPTPGSVHSIDIGIWQDP